MKHEIPQQKILNINNLLLALVLIKGVFISAERHVTLFVSEGSCDPGG